MKNRELILSGPEGQFVEFKQSMNSALARERVGFADTGGGTIVIGVNDTGRAMGLVITDPGKVPPGMKPEDMGKKSVRRNKLVADLFHRIGEVEKVGSGILRMEQALSDAGVNPFHFEFTGFCTIIFDRVTEMVEKEAGKTSMKTSVKILEMMKKDPEVSARQISEVLGITIRAVEMQTSKLQEKGKIKRVGPAKGGHWEVIDD